VRVRTALAVAMALLLGAAALVSCTPREHELLRRALFRGEIHGVTAQRLGLSWRPGCPVGPADLRLLTVSYWGFDGVGHYGELVVHRKVASNVVKAFRTLWNDRFPIAQMRTADVFLTPDDFDAAGRYIERNELDEANNTSAFMCRQPTAGSGWSEHSYGRAIDINPVQNPYVKGWLVVPPNGRRDPAAQGTISAGGTVVRAMAAAGFRWGGTWHSLRDYMHFSTTGR